MSVAFREIPATEGARKVVPGEGEPFDVAGAHLTWKVKGENSEYAFSVCEQTIDLEKAFHYTVTHPRRSSTFSKDKPISFVSWKERKIGFERPCEMDANVCRT
jgi:hypothetical protein